MTTATKARKTEKTSTSDQLADLDADVAAAKAERDRVGREAREHEAEVSALDRALNEIAQDDPDMFDNAGKPKAGTEAATIAERLAEARSADSRWPALIVGTENKLAAAERDAAHFRARHAEVLARGEYEAGEEDLAELTGLADQVLAVLARLRTREARLVAITVATPGRIDGRDVKVDPRLVALNDLLADHPTFYPPRSRSLTPLTGEVPPLRRSVSGGFIGGGHGADNYGDQPEPIEARR